MATLSLLDGHRPGGQFSFEVEMERSNADAAPDASVFGDSLSETRARRV
ncbi:hypothetical protein AACH06_14325 [Ideonella sp. DXS29W]|uniref:Type VI secretion system tip protein VgrG n=1 Tax=Ideonella lacteola TaxID=2984193 RepID=A0ABU9BTP0_9BURK